MTEKLVILGAAGQVAQLVTADLLSDTAADLVLYGRRVTERLQNPNPDRITLVDGDFNEEAKLATALQGATGVYLNDLSSPTATQHVIQAMKTAGVDRLIAVSMAGVENEVPAALTGLAKQILPASYIQGEIDSANLVKESGLDYTLLRLTFLYNDAAKLDYELIPSGTTFADAQVTREAVAKAVLEIMTHNGDGQYSKQSLGVGEPNTHFDKPSFF